MTESNRTHLYPVHLSLLSLFARSGSGGNLAGTLSPTPDDFTRSSATFASTTDSEPNVRQNVVGWNGTGSVAVDEREPADFEESAEAADLEDLRERVGEDGVLLRREKGLCMALSEDTTLVARFPGVVKGDDFAVLGSGSVGVLRRKYRGRGGTGRSLGFSGKRCRSASRPRLRVGYDFGSVPCRRREAADEAMVDARRCASSDLLRSGEDVEAYRFGWMAEDGPPDEGTSRMVGWGFGVGGSELRARIARIGDWSGFGEG